MTRNIVILLCLVFFTQSAFADLNFLCGDCRHERKVCRRNNDNCQKLRKADASKIAELEGKVKKLEAQNENLKITASVGVGFGAVVLGGIGYVLYQPLRAVRALVVQVIEMLTPNNGAEDQA